MLLSRRLADKAGRLTALFVLGLLLIATVSAQTRPAQPIPQDLPTAARDVFAAPDFWWKRIEPAQASPSWLESLLNRVGAILVEIVRTIGDALARLLHFLFGGWTGELDWSLGTLAVWILCAVLLAWAVWKISPALLEWLRREADSPKAGTKLQWQKLPQAAFLFDQATAAFKQGHYAKAVRFALLALIAELQYRALLHYDPSRTNREYQRELRPAPELAATFGRLARIYERIWYGQLPADCSDAEQAINLCRLSLASEIPAEH